MTKELMTMPIEYWIGVLALVFFLGLICFIIFAGMVVKAFRTLRGVGEKHEISPQPLVVQEQVEFATKDELQLVADQVTEIEKDIKAFRAEIVINGEKRRQSIEAKVQSVHKEVTDHVEAVRMELARDIKAMPSEVIAILRNTGAINKP